MVLLGILQERIFKGSGTKHQVWGLPWQLSWWRMLLQCRRPWIDSWVGKIRWRRDRLPTPAFWGFPCGSAGKESACNTGDLGSIPELGRSPGEKERLPTPVFWPGEFHGIAESDMAELLSLSDVKTVRSFAFPLQFGVVTTSKKKRFNVLEGRWLTDPTRTYFSSFAPFLRVTGLFLEEKCLYWCLWLKDA